MIRRKQTEYSDAMTLQEATDLHKMSIDYCMDTAIKALKKEDYPLAEIQMRCAIEYIHIIRAYEELEEVADE